MWLLFCVLLVPLLTGSVVMILLSIWLVARVGRRDVDPSLPQYPDVSVLVPHFNEDPRLLLQSLDALDAQVYPGTLRIFVVDDGSTNGVQTAISPWFSVARRREFRPVVFAQNNGSKGKAIDATLPHLPSETDVLVVLDSDTHVESDGILRLVERLWRDDDCAAVCGFIVPANQDDSFLTRLQYFEHIGIYPAVKSAQDRIGRVSVMAGAFVAHRMSVVRKIGGFGRWIVEDIAWTWAALAAGHSTGYAPDAVAYTHCPTSFGGLLRQRRRWARGRVEAFRAAFEISKWRTLRLAPLFLLWILSLSPPTLCLMPVLAVFFGQWWVFAVMAASSLLYLSIFQLYPSQIP